MFWQESLCRPAGDVLKDWRARYFVLEVLPEPRLCYYRALETGEGPAGELPLDGARVQVGISHLGVQPAEPAGGAYGMLKTGLGRGTGAEICTPH